MEAVAAAGGERADRDDRDGAVGARHDDRGHRSRTNRDRHVLGGAARRIDAPLVGYDAAVLRPLRADEHDWFYETRHDAFRVYAEQVFGPWDEAHHRAAAARDCRELPIEVVEHEGARIGYQIVLRHPDHWFLDEIAVVAGARGRGIGTALVTEIM